MTMEKIKDGNTEFRVIDKRLFSMLDLLYPVGRIIISNDSNFAGKNPLHPLKVQAL